VSRNRLIWGAGGGFLKAKSTSTYLDMLLQVLRTLECLSAEVAFMWFQWNMDTDVGRDVVTLDRGSAAGIPSTGQIQVVCAFPSNMLLTDMVLGER
jgi:hypothetical protein